MRTHLLTLSCVILAATAIALAPTPARAQFACEPGRYSMYSPGSLGVPADVRVQCTGTGFVLDVQWPFEPAAEWHNVYAVNASSGTFAITVGGRPIANLKFEPNPQAPPRFLIEGCPSEWGGNGGGVPWSDPCIRKVRAFIQRDLYFIKTIFGRDRSPASEALGAALDEMAREDTGSGDGSAPVPVAGIGGDVDPTKPPTTHPASDWIDEFRDAHPSMSVEGNIIPAFPGPNAPGYDPGKSADAPPDSGPVAPGTTIVPSSTAPAEKKP